MSKSEKPTLLVVTPPTIEEISIPIIGTAPYVQNRMSAKARREIEGMMTEKEERALGGNKKKPREARVFEEEWKGAMYVSREGWFGIPATGIRSSMVRACQTMGIQMTKARMSVFVLADGYDKDDETPLVRIIHGEPEMLVSYVKTQNKINMVSRPKWEDGWKAIVRLQFDSDMLSAESVANLLSRVGIQVGIGAGRPASSNSAGMGWGTFAIDYSGVNNGISK